jgi:hypothetical protein
MKKIIFFGTLLLTLSFVYLIPSIASAAILSISTDKTSFSVGDQFSVQVSVDSEEVGINGVQATVSFPKDILEVQKTDKTDSVFNLWLQDPIFSNDNGNISFTGVGTAGFSGPSLKVIKIFFKVKGAGKVDLVFTDSAVTANDGSGTNVLSSSKGLSFTSVVGQGTTTIAPKVPPPTQINRTAVPSSGLPLKPVITVSLYPNPDGWYNSISNFIVQWNLPNDITGVATEVNKEPLFVPTKSEGLFDNKTFEALSDGVWYLHVRFKNSSGWGQTIHYKIGIDTIPPIPFTISSKEGLDTSNVAPEISYETSDQPSGISSYSVSIDNNVVANTTSTSFVLPAQQSGNHVLLVRAVDFAGNITEKRVDLHIKEIPFFVIGGIAVTQLWFFISILVIIIIFFMAGWWLQILARKQKQRKTLIAQRDVVNAFDTIKNDIEKILNSYTDEKVSESELTDIKFSAQRINENLSKMEGYINEGIEDIEK